MILKFNGLVHGGVLNKEALILIYLSFFFLISGLLIILTLLISRVYKSRIREKEIHFRNFFRRMINNFLVNQTTEHHSNKSVIDFRLNELKNSTDSMFKKQLAINELIDLKKNLTGGYVESIFKIYHALELKELSLSKIKSPRWKIKAQGIRELAEMDVVEALPTISNFINSSNETLANESILAVVRLQKSDFGFLDHYKSNISPWMVLNIFHYLSLDPMAKIPTFSRWFFSSNKSVVLFSINMVRMLRQSSALKSLTQIILESDDPEIVSHAITTVGQLEAHQFAETIYPVAEKFWGDDQVSQAICKTVSKIGIGDEATKLLLKFSEHPSYKVRFEAINGLIALDEKLVAHPTLDKKIIQHLSEPLLK